LTPEKEIALTILNYCSQEAIKRPTFERFSDQFILGQEKYDIKNRKFTENYPLRNSGISFFPRLIEYYDSQLHAPIP
jgi:hypothetical protein